MLTPTALAPTVPAAASFALTGTAPPSTSPGQLGPVRPWYGQPALVRPSDVERLDVGGARHVAHVLLVLQAALVLLAGLGELLLMASPAYLPLVLGGPLLLLVVASAVGRGRRWGLVAAIVIEAVPLAAYHVSLLLGLLPQLDLTVNLVGLLANVALPLIVSWQCLRALTGVGR